MTIPNISELVTAFYFIYYLPTACFFVICFITNKKATVSTAPIGRVIQAFCTNPARINITKETAATLIEYGNCVET